MMDFSLFPCYFLRTSGKQDKYLYKILKYITDCFLVFLQETKPEIDATIVMRWRIEKKNYALSAGFTLNHGMTF